jgi:hypothetical protein
MWKKDKDIVRSTLDIITSTYMEQGVIDPSALSHAFMMGLASSIKLLSRDDYNISDISKALNKCKEANWPAFTIIRYCQGSGGGVSRRKTRDLITFLVNFTISNGRVPKMNEIDCLNLKFVNV